MARKAKENHGKKPQSFGDKMFDVGVLILLIIISVIVVYPMIFVVSCSFSDPQLVLAGEISLLPKGLTLEGYKMVLTYHKLGVAFRNTIIYTVVGTFFSVICTVMAAYALARKDLFGRTFLNWFISIPMWFSAGLIPTYLVVESIGLVNKPVIVILLTLISSYNLIICRAFLSTFPYDLQEAAMIDGASAFGILWKVMLPLSKPIVSLLSLYYAVDMWNSYFNPMIYVNDESYYPLQVVLRELLLLFTLDTRVKTMRYSLIVISSLPLLIVYPFLQKYFDKGLLIGSLKG